MRTHTQTERDKHLRTQYVRTYEEILIWLFLVLRSLPPLAKKYVLQMLYIDVPITASSMEEWVLADGMSKHRVAIDRLMQLRVFIETVDRYLCFLTSFILLD